MLIFLRVLFFEIFFRIVSLKGSNNRKSENIITGIGIDLTHNFFKQNKLLDPFKETILKNISKNDTLKKISKFISNHD